MDSIRHNQGVAVFNKSRLLWGIWSDESDSYKLKPELYACQATSEEALRDMIAGLQAGEYGEVK